MTSATAEQAPIGAHGLIGDMRTAALVDDRGGIDWLCWPRFDDPPLLSRLVDAGGARWELAPAVPFTATRAYVDGTNVLRTEFACGDGTAVAHDFMAASAESTSGSRLIRTMEAMSGSVPVRMEFCADDGFDGKARLLEASGGAGIAWSGGRARLVSSEPVDVARGSAGLDVVLEPGRPLACMLSAEPPPGPLLDHCHAARELTVRFWREWLSSCRLPAVRPREVARSALAVKLLEHTPSRSLVAAPTTSLPEAPGGSRNWDYRYTWLRDTSLMVLALQDLGRHEEAMDYWTWLRRVAERYGDDLAVAYRVDGEPVPEERTVASATGHRAARPVRVGNAAAGQRQHDVFGHVLSAAAHCYFAMDMDEAQPAEALRRIADLAARRWRMPDESIWELRGGRAHHTYSRVMCWHALDRAIALADAGALAGDRRAWDSQRAAVRAAVENRSWNARLGSFTAVADGEQVDAALLLLPAVGFLPASDPRVRATRSRIAERLSDRGLLRRYEGGDGLDGEEGAFLACTLWLADAHALDGDPEIAEALLDRVLSTGNDLGLLAEEADPVSPAPAGNFPQGLTHLAVIRSAVNLERAYDAQRSAAGQASR